MPTKEAGFSPPRMLRIFPASFCAGVLVVSEYVQHWASLAQKEQTGFSPGQRVFFRLQLSHACLARFTGLSFMSAVADAGPSAEDKARYDQLKSELLQALPKKRAVDKQLARLLIRTCIMFLTIF